jgi:hypothetical protein
VKSFIAALRSLILPYGAVTGARIVLDGVNGRIEVYDSSDFRVGLIDDTGVWQFNPDGSYVRLASSGGGFGALLRLQPGDVPPLTYSAGTIFATTFPGQDNVPLTAISSPIIQGPFVGSLARIYVLGEDDAHNPPMIDLRASGETRVLDGPFHAFQTIESDGLINGGYTHIDKLHLTASGNFDKTLYPLAKRITVTILAGGGGAGGAAATGAGQWSFGDGGGAGEYAQGTYNLAALANLTAYTVGAGGAGGVGGASGTVGGTTDFGGFLTAIGGGGAAFRGATGTVGLYSFDTTFRAGGSGGIGGHIRIPGGAGGSGNGFSATNVRAGDGGQSVLSGATFGTTSANGNAGSVYGGGGAGASNAQSLAQKTGGAGGQGIVMIDIYG